jgi:hypothetical protein
VYNLKLNLQKLCYFIVSSFYFKVTAWNELFPVLLTTYHDGYIAEALNTTTINMVKLFYPEWWLQAVGYYANRPNNFIADPAIIEFLPNTVSLFLSYSLFICR